MFKSIVYLGILCCSLLNTSEAEILKGVTILHKPYNELKNGQLEGFANDLTKEISNIVGFNYTLELTPDGKYGVIVNNTINGMLGEVHSNRADFAIADITITEQRRQYVDFTEPFIETGITILIHKNNAKNIHSFADLAQQTDIGYGAVLMGSTYHELSLSTDPTLAALYRHMTNNPADLVKNLREGVDRVLNGSNYAIITEKHFAEYMTGLHCGVTYIDDPNNNFMPRKFAIALNKNSNYTERFNSAIKQLKTSGKIESLRNRYWKKCGVLQAVTVPYPPYIEMNSGKMEGLVVDLVNKISTKTDLKIKLGLQLDGTYGMINQGKINGMLGELYNGWADLAVADITVTENRKQFVDFTEPFMESRLAILIRKEFADNIKSFKDLADQTTIPYGMLRSGSTQHFFSTSNDSTIQKMYQYLEANPSNYVKKNNYGVKHVKTAPFALILESAAAEYIAGKDCDLTYIVDQNNYVLRQYAIAVPKQSPYLDQLNKAILELNENGMIETMRRRYWKKCGVLTGVTVQRGMSADLIFGKVEGFVADIMNSIADISGIKYSLYFAPDNKHGSFDKSKVNGIIGEVYNKRADFAIADLTVTESRKLLVDFTEPFVETGLVILIHKQYTNTIRSFADLADQTDIHYGIMRNGSTHEFFARSNDSTLQKMYQEMDANPNNYFKRYAESVERLTTSPYAMIVERPFAEQMVGRICDLTLIVDNNHTFPRQFAIALPKGSAHLDTFNSAIRQLKTSGQIDTIMRRYRKTCGVLKGITVPVEPYIIESYNGMISGLSVDLMNEISALNNYNYTLNLQSDKRYGGVNETDASGMIGEVYLKLSDFAIADITVTDVRKKLIDFTEPLFESELVIVLHKNYANNISSFSDLAQQTDIKYGMLKGGSSYRSFKESADPTIAQMFRTMSESPDVFMSSYSAGFERVKDNSTGFAFFAEGMSAEYIVGNNCELTIIADPVKQFPQQYAIVLPKNSTYIQGFNSAISQLKANGVLNTLKDKYWKKCE